MKHILKPAAYLLASVAVLFSLQSCTSVKPIDKTQLSGYWVLKTLNAADAKGEFEGPIPSLEFDLEKNIVFGSGGCNRYTGGFNLTQKNEFSAPNLASTMMMCAHKNKESEFLAALSSPDLLIAIEKDGSLTFSQNKKVVLQFEKGEIPKQSGVQVLSTEALAGAWTLKSFSGEDLTKLFSEKLPTIQFNPEGTVFGNGGCNSYRGTFKLEENTLNFGPLMSTKMACPHIEGEGKFLALFSTPIQATINGETLTFLKGGNVVLEFTKNSVAE